MRPQPTARLHTERGYSRLAHWQRAAARAARAGLLCPLRGLVGWVLVLACVVLCPAPVWALPQRSCLAELGAGLLVAGPQALFATPWPRVPAPSLPPLGSLPGRGGQAGPGAEAARGADLDLSVSTDCEDLAVFAGDLFEFGQQARLLCLDALSPELLCAAGGVGLGLALASLGARVAKRR